MEGFVGEKGGFVSDAEMYWEPVELDKNGYDGMMLCCGRQGG